MTKFEAKTSLAKNCQRVSILLNVMEFDAAEGDHVQAGEAASQIRTLLKEMGNTICQL